VTNVELLSDVLRVRSVNPPGDEEGSPEGRSNLVARVAGPQDRPALVLLSHSDVVPVEEDYWTHDPFGGEIADGFIWGRGALDMKSIAVMHAVAAAQLANSARERTREVIVVMAADEEAGGSEGAQWLVREHPERVGFGEGRQPPEVVTEGAYGLLGALDRPVVPIALGEKTAVWFDLVAKGDPGHGALPPARQAPISLAKLVVDVAGFGTPRVHPVMREQFSILSSAASGKTATTFRALASPAGSVVAKAIAAQVRKAGALGLLLSDSITPTLVNAGYKHNVVPTEARAFFDCRLLPDTDVDRFIDSVRARADRRGGRIENVQQRGRGPVCDKGPLFPILEQASLELAPHVVTAPSLSPGITDARFFRAGGATAYGWCPLLLTPEQLATIHGHDERVEVSAFERAVKATTNVVMRAAS
jgi:acetylornithine deacetylase/succinyl-diaminopimelate desuccinylase-like protein